MTTPVDVEPGLFLEEAVIATIGDMRDEWEEFCTRHNLTCFSSIEASTIDESRFQTEELNFIYQCTIVGLLIIEKQRLKVNPHYAL
jgi:hypothetical protein